MTWIRRTWTPAGADDWTKEDLIAMVVSPLAYITLTLGVALSCFLLWYGFLTLGAGIVLTLFMHWVIDPKLKVISSEYEARQKRYLEELEKKLRWEEE